ncbi:MAG: MFS transporter [Thermoplasmata archaeon]|nr:MFS transporter [Thermoplasmata archaeon]
MPDENVTTDPYTGAVAGSASEIPPTGYHISTRAATFVVLGIFLALLMGALDNFVVLTALPNILQSLKEPFAGQTFVVSAYLITSTVAIPIFAKLSDVYNRKTVFLSGLVIFVAGSALAGLSQNFGELVVFRAIQGFGSGDFFPVGIAISAVIFPPAMRARVVGLLSGVFGIATVAGPFLGAFIVDHTTWRWIFYINIPIGLLGMAILLVVLGPILPERKSRFDIPGAALLAGWVGALMFALVQVSEAGWAWTDPRTLALLASSLGLFVIFVVWELRATEPLVPLRLLKRRVVAASGGTTLLVGLVIFPLATFLTFFITYVTLGGTGSASDTIRDVLYALVIPLVFGAATGGGLMTRLSYRAIAASGILIALVGTVFLPSFSTSTPVWTFAFGFLPTGGIVLPLIPMGFGVGLTFPVFLLAVQNQVQEADVGAAGGLIQFLQSLGGAVGLSLLSSFQEVRLQALEPTVPAGGCPTGAAPSSACLQYFQAAQSALASSYDQVFQVMLVLLVLALFCTFFLTGHHPRDSDPKIPATPSTESSLLPSSGVPALPQAEMAPELP